MRREAMLVSLGALVALSCVSKPEPWAPDGRADGTQDATVLNADGLGLTEIGGDVSCVPACEGRECGDDGCGGSCGDCGTYLICAAGACHPNYCQDGLQAFGCCAGNLWLWCDGDDGLQGYDCGKNDPPLNTCGWDSGKYKCGGSGPDPDGELPLECCQPDCSKSECGSDGCWGTCGTCDGSQEECVDGACICQSVCDGLECGDGGCAGDEDACGKCEEPQDACVEGVCVCQPLCEDKECGDDGCGGTCGGCDDGNICTDDSCTEGQCDFIPNAAECDDGNPCTLPDTCSEGSCVGEVLSYEELVDQELVGKCLCEADDDCADVEDGNLCNGTLYCHFEAEEEQYGICQVAQDTQVLCPDDGLWCTGGEACDPATGDCIHLDVPVLDDGVDCTVDSCDDDTDQVTHLPNDAVCDDGNPCTDDSCDPEAGCQNENNTAACDGDGDGCTTDECVDGICTTVESLDCSGLDDQCNAGKCVSTGAFTAECTPEPKAGGCDDGSACTIGDACDAGICVGQAKDCDDQDSCTDDSCDPAVGCLNAPLDCDDDDACTTDACEPDALPVCQHLPLECDDGNECTEDTCDSQNGCSYLPVPEPTSCDNGVGQCEDGQCVTVVPGEDLDHDGVCQLDTCPVQEPDTCPTTWDPDNAADTCAPLPEGLSHSRQVLLSQPDTDDGASIWRRTHEPVEVPLANGIVDDSVVLYLPFSGGSLSDAGPHNRIVTMAKGAADFPDGPSTSFSEAMSLDGSSCLKAAEPLSYPVHAVSVMAWFKYDVNAPTRVFDNWFFETSKGINIIVNDTPSNSVKVFLGDGAATSAEEYAIPAGEWLEGSWHHIAVVFDRGALGIYADGRLISHSSVPLSSLEDDGDDPTVGCHNNDISNEDTTEPLTLDELIVFNRVLSPAEVAVYYQSMAPYGTTFVPGAQADFDDLRATETTPGQAEHQVPFEVIGPRPHSDTPCPMEQDDGTWADREDLCGVVAYWPLDGDGMDATGKHDGVVHSTVDARGRLGKVASALGFDGVQSNVEVPHDPELGDLGQEAVSFTVEAWVLLPDKDSCGATVVNKIEPGNPGIQPLSLAVSGECKPAFAIQLSTQQAAMASSSKPLSVGWWHHLAGTRDRQTQEVRLYVDGVLSATGSDTFADLSTESNPLRIGCGSTGTGGLQSWFHGSIDEVIIHSVAKSPEYIYRRANPGVPMVRFLASTEPEASDSGGYPWYIYALHWGDPTALQRPPILSGPEADQRCYGLLSECIGYAGWWRFNEGKAGAPVDSSTWKWATSVFGGPEVAASPELVALSLDGVDDHLMVPDAPGLDLAYFTLEALTFPTSWDGDTNKKIIFKGTPGDGAGIENINYSLSYWLESASVFYEVGSGTDVGVNSPQSTSLNEWHAVEATHDDSTTGIYEESVLQKAIDYAGVAPANTSPLYIGSTNGLPGSPFAGMLDSIRIMSRALTPDEFLHYPLAGWQFGAGDWAEDCGGIVCPELDGYDVSCNSKDHCEYARTEQTEDWHAWDVWIYVPPGSFEMGSPQDEEFHSSDEEDPDTTNKMHPVTIDNGFLIAKYEAVARQYGACMTDKPAVCTMPSTVDYTGANWGTNFYTVATDPDNEFNVLHERPTHPQNGLTWQQSKNFCAWLAPGGRLPTEAEWEYAAKGPEHTKYPWGDSPTPTCSNGTAVFNELGTEAGYGCEQGGTWPVGSMQEGYSWCGAMDMGGNVWEWNEDWYHSSYSGAPSDASAWVVPSTQTRSQRGGSFHFGPEYTRSASRGYNPPAHRNANVGVRCVRPLTCEPDCADKQCGDDGCGGSCGECGADETCAGGSCEDSFHVWSKAFDGSGAIRAVSMDTTGSVLLAGDFGSEEIGFGGDILQRSGVRDGFVTKLGSDGSHIWTEQFSGGEDGLVIVFSMQVLGDDSMLLAGEFSGVDVSFGGQPIDSYNQYSDAFVARVSSKGDPVFSKAFGGDDPDTANSIVSAPEGSVYMVGSFVSSEIVFGDESLQNVGGRDIFVARLDEFGNNIWAKSFGGSGDDGFMGFVSSLSTGAAIIAGEFEGTIDFGGAPLNSAGGLDTYIVRLGADGSHIWSKQLGGKEFDRVQALAIDSDDNVYAAGQFMSADFTVDGVLVPKKGSGKDMFLTKWSAAGVHLWTKSFTGSGNEEPATLLADSKERVLVAGRFLGPDMDLGGGVLDTFGSVDAFVCLVDADGEHLWSKSFGGAGSDRFTAFAANAGGTFWGAGLFTESGFSVGGGPLSIAGDSGVFVTEWDL